MPAHRAPVDLAGLLVALQREVDADLRFDAGARHLYATDASNYRHVPLGVVAPRTIAALAATVAVCHERGVPLTLRGAGTSLAGQATNVGVIVDTSRHLTRILGLDPASRTAQVEPGVVLSDLQAAAAPHGLTFGPDPSTFNRCTLGGMLGNDSCGPHSLTTGRTSDNTVALEVVTGDAVPVSAGWLPLDAAQAAAAPGRGGAPDRVGALHAGLLALRDRVTPLLGRFPTGLPRLVSGIHLDRLCEPDGLHVAQALVGTEGTCAVVLTATVALVDRPAHRALAVLGYPDDVAAATAVPDLLAHGAAGLEGIDDHLVTGATRRGRVAGVDLLPPGRAWLLVETAGDTAAAARTRAEALATAAGVPSTVVTDPGAQQALWQLRAAGLGSITYTDDGRARLPGWEDAAVPPARLAGYLRGLHDLLDEHGLSAGIYGHYGDGCVHTKIDFDHATATGRATFRAFVDAATDLVVGLGGSLSGEHGDGQARGELLARMFGDEMVAAFRDFTWLWDPAGVLNPGRLVDAAPLDANLRGADRAERWEPETVLSFAEVGGVVGAFDRCVGAGTCRRDDGAATMCPSYRATHDEQHSTRGRARLLGELLRPDTALTGWGDPALSEALELCLSCKACVAECPVQVDIPTAKAEVAHHRFDELGERRPVTSVLLGRFRELIRAAGVAPRATQTLLDSAAGRRLWRQLGFAPERAMPPLAPTTFRASWRRRGGTRGRGAPVVLLVDTFTDAFAPEVAAAAVHALEATGHAVTAVTDVCCGRPRYAEGLLDGARRDLDRLVSRLEATGDAPVVWLEPSCLSVIRDELPRLRDDAVAGRVAERSQTLAELVVAEGWDLGGAGRGRPATLHPHCHHRAVLGVEADAAVLTRLGLDVDDLDAGCCGLAGSFGFVAGERYQVSMAVAADRFAPRLAATPTDATVVMDGFSCREQARHLGVVARPRHLAELLRDAVVPARARRLRS